MLIYRTAGGGGWKDRLDRPVEAVERDVAFGLVSARRRRVGATAWSIGDAAATEAERERQKAERGGRRWRSTSGPPVEEVIAQLRGGDGATRRRSPAKPLRWSPLESRESAMERAAVAEERLRRGGGLRHPPRGRRGRPQRRLHGPVVAAGLRSRRGAGGDAALLDVRAAPAAPVFFTTVDYDDVGEAAAAVFLRKAPALRACAPGTPLGRDRPAARAGWPSEPVLVKAHASAFFGTPFAAMLAGRDTLVVCGASTSGCVRATVVDAMQHGLAPIVPRECVGDRSARGARSRPWRTSTAATEDVRRPRGGARRAAGDATSPPRAGRLRSCHRPRRATARR